MPFDDDNRDADFRDTAEQRDTKRPAAPALCAGEASARAGELRAQAGEELTDVEGE